MPLATTDAAIGSFFLLFSSFPLFSVQKKKKKLWIRKAVYSVWMDTDQISVQTWQEKRGRRTLAEQ